MKSDTVSTFAAGVIVGIVASFALYLSELRGLSAEVEALQRELDDLIEPDGPPPFEREKDARSRQPEVREPGAAAAPADPYQAQVRRREVGRGRREERGDFDMVD